MVTVIIIALSSTAAVAASAAAPVIKMPVITKPVIKLPAINTPVIKIPATKNPATKKPAKKKPAKKKPATKKPAKKKLAAKKPTTKKPATKNPAKKKPTQKKPEAQNLFDSQEDSFVYAEGAGKGKSEKEHDLENDTLIPTNPSSEEPINESELLTTDDISELHSQLSNQGSVDIEADKSDSLLNRGGNHNDLSSEHTNSRSNEKVNELQDKYSGALSSVGYDPRAGLDLGQSSKDSLLSRSANPNPNEGPADPRLMGTKENIAYTAAGALAIISASNPIGWLTLAAVFLTDQLNTAANAPVEDYDPADDAPAPDPTDPGENGGSGSPGEPPSDDVNPGEEDTTPNPEDNSGGEDLTKQFWASLENIGGLTPNENESGIDPVANWGPDGKPTQFPKSSTPANLNYDALIDYVGPVVNWGEDGPPKPIKEKSEPSINHLINPGEQSDGSNGGDSGLLGSGSKGSGDDDGDDPLNPSNNSDNSSNNSGGNSASQ